MELKKNDKKGVMPWHWNQPENGLSIEECEQLAEELLAMNLIYKQSSSFAIFLR